MTYIIIMRNVLARVSFFKFFLSDEGFTGLFKRRTGTKTDGCAIFYHESKLKLLEWKALEYQRKTKALNRDNVAILAKFATIEKQ